MASDILFAIQGTLIDFVEQRIPIYKRGTSIILQQSVGGSLSLYSIDANKCAIDRNTGSIYLEPPGTNLLTWNADLTQPEWVEGASVFIDPRSGLGADGSSFTDAITFAGGDTSPTAARQQTLERAVELEAETDYQLTVLLRLENETSQFADSPTNVLRVTGDVASGEPVQLSDLNAYPGQWRLLTLPFKTGGKQPKILTGGEQPHTFGVDAVNSGTTLTMTSGSGLASPVLENELVGGTLMISDPPEDSTGYVITANGASTGNTIDITLESTDNIIGDGVTTASQAVIEEPPKQNVLIELYSTSIAKVYFGGAFLERGTFPTSLIFQKDAIFSRDGVSVTYLQSPIAGMSSFGAFIDLEYWKADGNLLDLGNFNLDIDQGDLRVTAGGTVVRLENLAEQAAIYVQVSAESQELSVYINQVLVQQVALPAFTADQEAKMDLTSVGVRAIRRLMLTLPRLDGQIAIGQKAEQGVGALFEDDEVIPFEWLATSSPRFELPLVSIPGKTPPIAQTMITGVSSNSLDVVDSTGFVNGAEVRIYKGLPGLEETKLIKVASIASATGVPDSTTINLVDAGDIEPDFFIVYGEEEPGTANVRFPFTPIDSQQITAVDPASNQLTVQNATSFILARAFVRDSFLRDVAEVIVEQVDTANDRLVVNRAEGISVGDTIAQIKLEQELLISPTIYGVSMLDQIDGVSYKKYANGIVLTNYNTQAVQVRMAIQVAM